MGFRFLSSISSGALGRSFTNIQDSSSALGSPSFASPSIRPDSTTTDSTILRNLRLRSHIPLPTKVMFDHGFSQAWENGTFLCGFRSCLGVRSKGLSRFFSKKENEGQHADDKAKADKPDFSMGAYGRHGNECHNVNGVSRGGAPKICLTPPRLQLPMLPRFDNGIFNTDSGPSDEATPSKHDPSPTVLAEEALNAHKNTGCLPQRDLTYSKPTEELPREDEKIAEPSKHDEALAQLTRGALKKATPSLSEVTMVQISMDIWRAYDGGRSDAQMEKSRWSDTTTDSTESQARLDASSATSYELTKENKEALDEMNALSSSSHHFDSTDKFCNVAKWLNAVEVDPSDSNRDSQCSNSPSVDSDFAGTPNGIEAAALDELLMKTMKAHSDSAGMPNGAEAEAFDRQLMRTTRAHQSVFPHFCKRVSRFPDNVSECHSSDYSDFAGWIVTKHRQAIEDSLLSEADEAIAEYAKRGGSMVNSRFLLMQQPFSELLGGLPSS